jgi:hypothetical protein
LLVLPYVSLVAEKSLALEQFTTALGFRTEVPPPAHHHLMACTVRV